MPQNTGTAPVGEAEESDLEEGCEEDLEHGNEGEWEGQWAILLSATDTRGGP